MLKEIIEKVNLKKYDLIIKNGTIRVRKKLTMKNAILEKCADCSGYWRDGKAHADCEVRKCSLYKWQPSRKKTPILDWLEFNPKRKGRQKWIDMLLNVLAPEDDEETDTDNQEDDDE